MKLGAQFVEKSVLKHL